jgi:HAE1 family hydrophobic/amphiphilic exporter-1
VRAKLASLHLDERVDRLDLVEDAATDIQSSLNGLLEEGLLGALLAVLVIWLFLGSLRATLVTAVSLPTSVMVALAGTNAAGYSLNVLTLAGLTIAVGRIVDDAIVVLENSYRHLQRGESPREAALNGATEVWAPVVSSTLTTVAVFLPIGTLGGVISKFFLPFSVTVTIALLGSLLVALTVIPVLVSFFLERGRGQAGPGRLVRVYRPLLSWSLGPWWRKAVVLAVAALLLGLSFVPVATRRVPINFLSSAGSGELYGSVVLPPGTTADDTSERLKAFEKRAQDDPQVKLINVTLASTDYGAYSAGFSSNVARLTILVEDRHQGGATRDRLGKILDELYGKGNWSLEEVGFVQSGNFQVTLSGRDLAKLRDASDNVVSRLREDTNLTNVQASLQTEQPELLITVDQQKAAARGLDPQQVAGLVAQVLNPRPLGTLAGSAEPVTLRLADPKLLTPTNLALLPLGPGVQLSDVATIGRQAAPVDIERADGVRRVSVSADFVGQDASGISVEAGKRLSKVALPAGVTLSTGGASTEIDEAFGEMYQAILVAIAIVALILVAFFRSVVTPFVILLTMPLALIGGLLALFITQQPLGLPALMGVLMVFGIVVSNAILLVDFSDRAARARPVREALLLAGSIRLRPILMTAVATIVALLPIAVGLSGGGGGLISQSLAVVVEGGLISSTGLTLLVIPVVYSLIKRRTAEITVEDEPAPPTAMPPWMHFRERTGS